MMSRHFGLNSELPGAIAKRIPHAKNLLSVTGSFFNQFVDIYIHINRVLIVRIYSYFITTTAKLSFKDISKISTTIAGYFTIKEKSYLVLKAISQRLI